MKKTIQILPILFVLFISQNLFSQTTSKSKIQLSGNAGIYGDFYHLKSDTVGAVLPRRPAFQSRFVANVNLSYKKLSLPFSCTIVPGNTSFFYPTVALPGFGIANIKKTITNPINRVGLAPKYKSFQLFLGSNVPNYSDLSVGDLSVFGVGFAYTPKKWVLAAYTGNSQIAINRDSIRHIDGNYKRKLSAIKLGVGTETSNQIFFILAKSSDDTTSLSARPIAAEPINGLVASMVYRINLSKKVYFTNEIAGSGFTRNVYQPEISNPSFTIPRKLFITRISSRFDYASIATLGKEGKIFGIKFIGKYYGDGFAPVGFPFMQTDRLDVTIDPKYSSKNNKLQLTGSFGKRVNNLSGMRGVSTAQTIGMANLNYQLSKTFSLAANAANFGFKNTITNDTFRLETTTLFWSISPSCNLANSDRSHTINLLFAQNNYLDLNIITGTLNDNNSRNIAVNYFYLKYSNQLGLTALLSYFNNQNVLGNLETLAANLGVSYSFFKKSLHTHTGLTHTINTYNLLSNGKQWMWNLGAKYKLNKKIALGLNGSINMYKYGITRPGIGFRENLLRTFLTYKF